MLLRIWLGIALNRQLAPLLPFFVAVLFLCLALSLYAINLSIKGLQGCLAYRLLEKPSTIIL